MELAALVAGGRPPFDRTQLLRQEQHRGARRNFLAALERVATPLVYSQPPALRALRSDILQGLRSGVSDSCGPGNAS